MISHPVKKNDFNKSMKKTKSKFKTSNNKYSYFQSNNCHFTLCFLCTLKWSQHFTFDPDIDYIFSEKQTRQKWAPIDIKNVEEDNKMYKGHGEKIYQDLATEYIQEIS